MGSIVIGNGRTLQATFTNSLQQVYDPANVYFIIESPPAVDGSVVKTVLQYGVVTAGWPNIIKVSTGVYQLVLPAGNLNFVGNWHWRVDDGNNVVAADADFQVTPSSATH